MQAGGELILCVWAPTFALMCVTEDIENCMKTALASLQMCVLVPTVRRALGADSRAR